MLPRIEASMHPTGGKRTSDNNRVTGNCTRAIYRRFAANVSGYVHSPPIDKAKTGETRKTRVPGRFQPPREIMRLRSSAPVIKEMEAECNCAKISGCDSFLLFFSPEGV